MIVTLKRSFCSFTSASETLVYAIERRPPTVPLKLARGTRGIPPMVALRSEDAELRSEGASELVPMDFVMESVRDAAADDVQAEAVEAASIHSQNDESPTPSRDPGKVH